MNLKYLDIAIGLIFLYLILSLFATTAMEVIATMFRLRASTLKDTIRKMLDYSSSSCTSTNKFYALPLISFLGESKFSMWLNITNENMPNYLEPKNFSRAILQMLNLSQNSEGSKKMEELIESEKLDFSRETRLHLLNLWSLSNQNQDEFKNELEQWFDECMERTTDWYKRKVQYILIIIGFIVAFSFDADTFKLVRELQTNPEVRNSIVLSAAKLVQENEPLADTTHSHGDIELDSAISILASEAKKMNSESNNLLALNTHPEWTNLGKIFGYLITAIAISLGSTFWFDLLKKAINIRALGRNLNVPS